MANPPGVFIALEGSDGAGKATQLNLLAERLRAIGYDVAIFDFPRYDKESSHFVREYLNGSYGPAASISPYTASLFYALDRYEAATDIKKALDDGKIVLSNRYVGSNMAHQGGKFTDSVEQRGFFVWADNLEFQLLGIPRPDLNIFLRVPAAISYELIKRKQARSYTTETHDQHEKDMNHLKSSITTFDTLCKLFPKDFKAIECTKDKKLLSIPEINNRIWSAIKPILPAEKPHKSHKVTVNLDRLGVAEETAGTESDVLVHKFKDVSLLLFLQIKRHNDKLINGQEPRWQDIGYKFYKPQGLPKTLDSGYKKSMGRLADLHKALGPKLGKNDRLLTSITPLAALCSFEVHLTPKEAEDLISDLLLSELSEVQWAAKQLFTAAKQQWPGMFKDNMMSRGGQKSINSIIAKVSDGTGTLSSSGEDVKLLEALPRQEFDLLAESIYPYSNLSLDELEQEISEWPYKKKLDSLRKAAAQPDLLAAKIHYRIEAVSDQLVIDEAIRAGGLSDVRVQVSTPRYGYEVPAEVEESGADEQYIECFDESLKLFSAMQAADKPVLSAYAALMGHKTRWQLNASAKTIAAMLKSKGSDSYKTLAKSIKEAVEEAHPLIWEAGDKSQDKNPAVENSNKSRQKPRRRRSSKSKKS